MHEKFNRLTVKVTVVQTSRARKFPAQENSFRGPISLLLSQTHVGPQPTVNPSLVASLHGSPLANFRHPEPSHPNGFFPSLGFPWWDSRRQRTPPVPDRRALLQELSFNKSSPTAVSGLVTLAKLAPRFLQENRIPVLFRNSNCRKGVRRARPEAERQKQIKIASRGEREARRGSTVGEYS